MDFKKGDIVVNTRDIHTSFSELNKVHRILRINDSSYFIDCKDTEGGWDKDIFERDFINITHIPLARAIYCKEEK